MTVYRGLLLFDYPETAIGLWENQLGYRGYMEVWKHKETNDLVVMDVDEDSSPEDEDGNPDDLGSPIWEIRLESGDNKIIDYPCISGRFSQVDKWAKEWMAAHPKGMPRKEGQRQP
jgi:hypothetical protein